MIKQPVVIKPAEIEGKSFEIIESEFFVRTGKEPAHYPFEEFAVIRRVIHATGDFSFAESLTFHPQAIKKAMTAIKAGKNILTDVNMAAAGISNAILAKWGGKVICNLNDPEIADLAQKSGQTRSETAISSGLSENIGIVAIGNAPTALLKVMEILDGSKLADKPLVIGAPVGFVNAEESKEILAGKDYPFISARGRKGGSPVAAAIVNALLRLC